MDFQSRFTHFLSHLFQGQKSLVEIAIAEGLDEFVELETSEGGTVKYSTVHGCRTLSSDRPELSSFVVLTKGFGYAKAVPLPYNRYLPNCEFNDHRLVRDLSPIPTAIYAAYGKAAQLPDEVYLKFHSTCCFNICLPNSLKVSINSQNEEATSAGYANAVPIPISKNDIYIEDLQMLDTEYAASLVDFPRFG